MDSDLTSGTADMASTIISNQFYKLRLLTRVFGAEILGVDLAKQEFSKEFINQIKDDIKCHRVLLFRDQKDISGQRQVDFSTALGTVESTFYKHPRSPHPDIFRVSNDEGEGCTNVGRTGWHIDGTFMATPFKYQTMYFPSVSEGGDTYFIPLKELYESQEDENTKRLWDRLWMVTGRGGGGNPVHPLIYKHPFRGDTTMCFHCGEPFCAGWLEDEETEPKGQRKIRRDKIFPPQQIQEDLTVAIEERLDTIGLKMKWQAGDFSINDNLGLAHYACPGTQTNARKAGLRILHRTTIIGGDETIPRKDDGRRSFAIN